MDIVGNLQVSRGMLASAARQDAEQPVAGPGARRRIGLGLVFAVPLRGLLLKTILRIEDYS